MNRLKIVTFTAAAFAFAALASCDDKKTVEEPKAPENGTFIGTVQVDPNGEGAFKLENAQVRITVAEDGKTMAIEMLKVKFVERMPTMDIVIPGVALTKVADGDYSITGDEIVPTMAGGPVPERTITDLEGHLLLELPSFSSEIKSLHFKMTCMGLEVNYMGVPATAE